LRACTYIIVVQMCICVRRVCTSTLRAAPLPRRYCVRENFGRWSQNRDSLWGIHNKQSLANRLINILCVYRIWVKVQGYVYTVYTVRTIYSTLYYIHICNYLVTNNIVAINYHRIIIIIGLGRLWPSLKTCMRV